MFSQNLTLEEAFETHAQIDKELKMMAFNGAFCKKFRQTFTSNFKLSQNTLVLTGP